MLSKVWIKLLINSSTSTVQLLSLGMDKEFHPTLYNGCNYLSMVGLDLNHVSKRGPNVFWDIITHPYPNFKLKLGMNESLYSMSCMIVMTYPCHDADDGLANLW